MGCLQLLTGETVSTKGYHWEKVNADKVRKTMGKSIVISEFKENTPPISEGLGAGKESDAPITEILTPHMCNDHDVARDGLPRVSA